MKILVTGGAGFIGSHLAEALVREGHAVRVLDNLSAGKLANLAAVQGDVEVQQGDVADPDAVAQAVRGVEVVYHEAAVPSVARSVADPLGSHATNVSGTLTLLHAARDAGVRRFVFAGSSSVYGDQPGRFKVETMTPVPLSPYATAKLASEHYVRIFATLYGMETLTLRYFNVFGPRQDAGSPYSGVISLFASALLERRRPVIYGDGRQSRDFTYVANVVDGNLRALHVAAGKLKGQTVNMATGRRVTLLELLAALEKLTGREARVRHLETRAGDIRHSLADIGAARRLLRYEPSVPFAEGLAHTVAWYREEVRAHRTGSARR